jgi:lipopolysaccharide export system protein LptA
MHTTPQYWSLTETTLAFIAFVLIQCISTQVLAQSSKIIELKQADQMEGKEIRGESAREFTGKVHFVQTTADGERVKLWCDRAIQYLKQNKVELYGHVRIVRDSVTITADEGRYFGNERRAEVSSNVRLVRGSSVLTSKTGIHFVDDKRSRFLGNVHLVDTASSITCDELVYIDSLAKSIAMGNVRVVNYSNSATVFGDSLVHFEKERYTIVHKSPKLVQIDTAVNGRIDTLLVVSKIMESYQDSTERFVAIDSVQIARSALAAVCGKTTFLIKRDLIILQDHPIVWESSNQVTGDSIVIGLKNKKLRTVYVKGRAMALSRADSLHKNRYDQLTGRELTMYFADDRLERVFVNVNATSFYYIFDNEQPSGANKSSGDKIYIDFLEGKIDQIKIVGGVQGQFFPEKMLLNREQQYNLDGFRWHAIRPRRKNLTIVQESYD